MFLTSERTSINHTFVWGLDNPNAHCCGSRQSAHHKETLIPRTQLYVEPAPRGKRNEPFPATNAPDTGAACAEKLQLL